MTLRRSSLPRVPTTLPLTPQYNEEGYGLFPVYNFAAGNATNTQIVQVTGITFALNAKLISIRAYACVRVTATGVPESFPMMGYLQLSNDALSAPMIVVAGLRNLTTGSIGPSGPGNNAWFNDGLYSGMVTWDIEYGPKGVPISNNGPFTMGIRVYSPVAIPALDTLEVGADFVFQLQS